MGCHTWTYKKIESLNDEEWKTFAKDEISNYNPSIFDNFASYYEYNSKVYDDLIIDYKNNIDEISEQLRNKDNYSLEYIAQLEVSLSRYNELYNEYTNINTEENHRKCFNISNDRYLKYIQSLYNGKDEFLKNNIEINNEDNEEDVFSNVIDRNGIKYCQICFDMPFRVYGYPEETFSNREKLIDWLKTYDKASIGYRIYDHNGCYSGNIDGNNPKFSMDYLINDINDYYKNNGCGDDDLYFEFG